MKPIRPYPAYLARQEAKATRRAMNRMSLSSQAQLQHINGPYANPYRGQWSGAQNPHFGSAA